MKEIANCTAIKLYVLIMLLLLCGCTKQCEEPWEPSICYTPPARFIERLPSPFKELSAQERATDWGKELYLGKHFAHEMDLYRALTCFKSALYLIPPSQKERQLEIEYDIFLAYFMGNKFNEAIEAFEESHLFNIDSTFPAYREILIALHKAYLEVEMEEKACNVLKILYDYDESTANELTLGIAVQKFDFCTINDVAPYLPIGEDALQFEADYFADTLSVSKARQLSALLPGAGYYYVGQKKAAVTSFIINSLFIAAAYQLFNRGYIAGGIIVSSLEMGWYFGGINGAGLAAEEFNQALYNNKGREFLLEKGLFPVLTFHMGF